MERCWKSAAAESYRFKVEREADLCHMPISASDFVHVD
jgi:hypothetical protein